MKAEITQMLTQELKSQAKKAQFFGGLQKPEAECHKQWYKWKKEAKGEQQEAIKQLISNTQKAQGQAEQPHGLTSKLQQQSRKKWRSPQQPRKMKRR